MVSTWKIKHDWKGEKSSDAIWSKEQIICMMMSSLSGFAILAGTICKQTLHETCYLI
jgi:hypothetical protein